MSIDLSSVRFLNKIIDSGKWPADMDELVTARLAYWAAACGGAACPVKFGAG